MAELIGIVGFVSAIAQLIDATIQTYSYLNDVVTAEKARASLALDIINLVPLLTKLRNRVELADPSEPWAASVQALGGKNGPFEQFKEVMEQTQKKLRPADSAVERLGRRLIWTLTKKEASVLLNRIESFKSLLQIALANDLMDLSRAIKSDTAQIAGLTSNVDKMTQDIQDINLAEQLNTRRALLEEIRSICDRLTPLRFDHRHNAALEARAEGTCEWFFQSDTFKQWYQADRAFLSCQGNRQYKYMMDLKVADVKNSWCRQDYAHVGMKQRDVDRTSAYPSYRSATIDHLRRLWEHNDGVVLYAYCSFEDQPNHHAVNFAANFLAQLIRLQESIPPELQTLIQRKEREGTRTKVGEIVPILVSELKKYSRAFVVIDALDEFNPSNHSLEPLLWSLQKVSSIMVTSRYSRLVKGAAMFLDIVAPPADIERYVDAQFSTLPPSVSGKPDLRTTVVSGITALADGIFILARLYMGLLRDKITAKQVKVTLQGLKHGKTTGVLDFAYGETMKRIEASSDSLKDVATKTLGILLFTKRPLRIMELQVYLAIDEADTELDEDNIVESTTILSACMGLVVMEAQTDSIHLVHYTAKEYLRLIGGLGLMRDRAGCIAKTCLTYLNFDAFKVPPCKDDDELASRLQKHSFLEHAADSFSIYITSGLRESSMMDDILALLASENVRTNIVQVYYGTKFDGDSQYYPKNMSALSVAVALGLSKTVDKLLDMGADLEARDSYGCTVLLRAARSKRSGIISRLISKHANVHAQDLNGQTALHAASMNGDEVSIDVLLHAGADHAAKDGKGSTALHLATMQRHKRAVEVLLSHDADITIENNDGQSPLHIALEMGSKETIQMMLKQRVQIGRTEDSANVEAQQKIQQALSGPDHDVLVQLLDAIPLDFTDSRLKQTALHLAAEVGNVDVVELLCGRKWNVDRMDYREYSAITYAAENGHEHVIKILLDHGAQLDRASVGKAFLPPLRAGAQRLVEGVFHPPLHAAAQKGQKTTVELLLHRGADPNSTDRVGFTALHAAVKGQHAHIVKLLLDAGTEIDKTLAEPTIAPDPNLDGSFVHLPRTPLRLAVDQRVKPACWIDSEGVNGETAEAIVTMLLERSIAVSGPRQALRECLVKEAHKAEILGMVDSCGREELVKRAVHMLCDEARYRQRHSPYGGSVRPGGGAYDDDDW
ncbi:hypothetical protein LTR50_000966 [Elasticomyces elasticus]|nr:hypothetical protein LTR50_000966 [Elasticomyces elasticus]